jgi:VWFA-related protein
MKARPFAGLMVAVCCAGATSTAAQVTFRSQIELVRVDVSVTRDGTPVAGLVAQDFEVRDNGRRQQIREILVDNVPLDVTLVLDTSTSVAGHRLEQLQQAAARLLQGLRFGDRAALITFGNRISRRVPLTSDLSRIRRLIDGLDGNGSTALYDAIFAGLLQPEAPSRRSAMVVFTDGLDTVSWLGRDDIADAARHGGGLVYTVTEIPDPLPGPRSPATFARTFLKTLAESSGGRGWWVPGPDQFGEAFGQILEDIRTRYLLVYQPEGVAEEGWHALAVKLTRTNGTVSARPGYFRR